MKFIAFSLFVLALSHSCHVSLAAPTNRKLLDAYASASSYASSTGGTASASSQAVAQSNGGGCVDCNPCDDCEKSAPQGATSSSMSYAQAASDAFIAGDYQAFASAASTAFAEGQGSSLVDICSGLYKQGYGSISQAFSSAAAASTGSHSQAVAESIAYASSVGGGFYDDCLEYFVPQHFKTLASSSAKSYVSGSNASASAFSEATAAVLNHGGYNSAVAESLSQASTNGSFATATAESLATTFKSNPTPLCSAYSEAQTAALAVNGSALAQAASSAGCI